MSDLSLPFKDYFELLPKLASTSEQISLHAHFPSKREQIQLILDRLQTLLPSISSEIEAHKICLGLREILMNAHEHGNLEIQDKEGLLAEENYENHLSRLENDCKREIQLYVCINESQISFSVRDEGKGFKAPQKDSVGNVERLSGRGITLAKSIFDSVTWTEEGNTCNASVNL